MRVKSYNYLRASIEGYLESPFQSGPLSTVLGKTCDEGPIRLGLSYCAVAGPIINDYRLQPLGGKTRDDSTYRPLFVVRSHTDRNALLHRVSPWLPPSLCSESFRPPHPRATMSRLPP